MKARRKCERYSVDLPVSVQGLNVRSRQARMINLSARGAAVLMSAPAEVGTTVQLRFSIATDTISREFMFSSRVIHNTEATVTQAQTREENFVVGCLFLNVSATDQAILHEYLSSADT